jgi:hypothetical protein
VQLIDRAATAGPLGWLDRWQARFRGRALNLVTMGCWSGLFVLLLGSGYVQAPHPGEQLDFWQRAAAEGKPRAGENLVKMLQNRATRGSPDAINRMGVLYREGELLERDLQAATQHFARACELGSGPGCANLFEQFLAQGNGQPADFVLRALDVVEQGCGQVAVGRPCFLLGRAFETGRGRPRDLGRALALYREACAKGLADACEAVPRLEALVAQ